jgi:hydrogenase small subunit
MKYCGVLAGMIGLGEGAAAEVAMALEKATKTPIVIWSDFQECAGCTVALLQSTAPTPAELLLKQISLAYNEIAMAAAGDRATKSLEQALAAGAYWVAEGSIATKTPGMMTVGGKTSEELAKEIYPKVKGAIAIGSCACFGNVQAARPNPSGAMGVGEFLRTKGGIPDAKVINLPRCPGHGEDLVATLTYILVTGKLPELDAEGRPVFLYGELIHDNCERRGHFEASEFVEGYGDPNWDKGWCLFKVGCKGPVTYAPCGVNRWNGRVSWCVANGPCIGCSENNFWNDLTPFGQRVPNVPVPGIAGIPPQTIGWGLAGVTAVGLGVHAIGQVATGRAFKGGPVADPSPDNKAAVKQAAEQGSAPASDAKKDGDA